MDDLAFTSLAELVAMIDRPDIPRESTNATGDRIVTDGKIAVVLIRY